MDSYTLLKKSTICFSILVTEECNRACEYCHFFDQKNKKKLIHSISDELLLTYLDFIKYLINVEKQNVQIRFSGGEPLLLGDRLFEISKITYDTTGIKPYVLTNGSLITKETIEKAKSSNVSAFVVSLENPLKNSDKSLDLKENINRINFLSSPELPLIPGVVVVENNYFNDLYDICDFFYKELGQIPTISEKSFGLFQYPTNLQLQYLEENLIKIVKKYFKKTPVRLFPYITPELCSNYNNEFVIDLPCNNRFNLSPISNKKSMNIIFLHIKDEYLNSFCNKKDCDLKNGCTQIKRFWNDKMDIYCTIKKIIYKSIFFSLGNE